MSVWPIKYVLFIAPQWYLWYFHNNETDEKNSDFCYNIMYHCEVITSCDHRGRCWAEVAKVTTGHQQFLWDFETEQFTLRKWVTHLIHYFTLWLKCSRYFLHFAGIIPMDDITAVKADMTQRSHTVITVTLHHSGFNLWLLSREDTSLPHELITGPASTGYFPLADSLEPTLKHILFPFFSRMPLASWHTVQSALWSLSLSAPPCLPKCAFGQTKFFK